MRPSSLARINGGQVSILNQVLDPSVDGRNDLVSIFMEDM
jgi:hypothetical protein